MDFMALTVDELRYIEACIQVADCEGEHAEEFSVDQQKLQMQITVAIQLATRVVKVPE